MPKEIIKPGDSPQEPMRQPTTTDDLAVLQVIMEIMPEIMDTATPVETEKTTSTPPSPLQVENTTPEENR